MVDLGYTSALAAFLAISTGILLTIHSKQPQPYLDEIFHIPQAQKYCEYKFKEWDPKITTLPGVYVVSFALLKVTSLITRIHLLAVCSVFWLRFTNVLFAVGNAWLLREILIKLNSIEERPSKKQKKEGDECPTAKCSITALTLSLFPVLYFFTFLYYTDAGSTFFVLLMYSMSLNNNHILASIAGFVAIMFRQTNVVWVIFTAGTVALNHLKPSVSAKLASQKEDGFIQELKKYIVEFYKHIFKMISLLWPYGFFVACFMVFIFINGSIVLGDRSSHTAALNFPQIFYFLGFTLVFSSPLLLLPNDIIQFIKAIRKVISRPLKLISLSLLVLLIAGLISKFTYVHKYLLADNRHYPFYVWRKFYARHWAIRYLAISVYLYAACGISSLLSKGQSFIWQFIFWICVTVVTVPQQLLEFRYFIVPYILFRLHAPLLPYHRLALEFIIYVTVNLTTLYLFLEKPFVWPHEPNEIQRFMW